ncbi:nucleoside phosphorylase domain-containing protein [Plectosphaerella cucumerina]|uniref:Nucleoside phosphorylase domain-containing protein n=1 Tax=Plectosphaerella cucumerina TaxID=40658 RepID=A0A8K0TGJ3_9PEZI|nr:nucleoside phosphorylase domain-containing protein [Plectosphaerella cucumerina]
MPALRDPVNLPLTRPASRADFQIAVICALPIESAAQSPRYGKVAGDRNTYSAGAFGRHNVVLVHMPGMGKSSAAAAASSCRFSYPNIKLALLVGVCGVLPTSSDGKEDIFLGDVILSEGVIQYDFGRRLPSEFQRKSAVLDALPRPNPEIRGLLSKLKGVEEREKLVDKTAVYLGDLQRQDKLSAAYPGVRHDSLFNAKYRHLRDGKTCDECGCSRGQAMRRRRALGVPQPAIHFGLFASGDTVMRSGEDRDCIVTQEQIIAFEMEAAGLWEAFPCVVVKGACDYADSHKMKASQRYAAATAAACAKAFVDHWEGSDAGSTFPSSGAGTDTGRRFEIPFLRNKKFVGREDTLGELRARLFDDDGPQRLALVGLGGVGKTQVALQIAYWVKEQKPDWSVFWLPALSMAGFEQTCADMVRRLGLEGPDKEDPKSARSGRWLLIVDNADDMTTVFGDPDSAGFHRHLPESPHGRVLFTTRSTDVALAVADDNVELGEMSKMDAGRGAPSYLSPSPSGQSAANVVAWSCGIVAEVKG